MNREEYFRTDYASLHANRTKFHMPLDVMTTFNTGDIIPLVWEEIDPGDSIVDNISYMLRLQTPIAPFMSRCFLDVYAFFIPNRIVWNHWEEFYGQNNVSAWTQTFDYSVPQSTVDFRLEDGEDNSEFVGTLADYMGLPITSNATFDVSDLPLRAYTMVYNEWFRDENVIAPVLFSKEDTHQSNLYYSSKPLKAAKFHDYFTSLLPSPQKGTPVDIGGYLPVMVGDPHPNQLGVPDPDNPEYWVDGAAYGLQWSALPGSGSIPLSSGNAIRYSKLDSSKPAWTGVNSSGASTTNAVDLYTVPNNLWAQLNITIETIRNAAVVQHVFENMARFGSRYVESLRGLWGVTPADATLQIPEYLGGRRFQLQISDVVSTADTVDSSQEVGEFLGQVGAYSKNKDGSSLVVKSFTEHGIYLVVGVIRIEQHYFQGLAKKWTRKKFFDFYLPELQNVGYQPVYTRELVMSPNNAFNKVLGYAEAWSEKRYRPDQITGLLRPDVVGGLSYYNASDIFDGDVSLNPDLITMSEDGLDRTLAVPSTVRKSAQWFGQFHFDTYWTKRMDPHSIPGIKRI